MEKFAKIQGAVPWAVNKRSMSRLQTALLKCLAIKRRREAVIFQGGGKVKNRFYSFA